MSIQEQLSLVVEASPTADAAADDGWDDFDLGDESAIKQEALEPPAVAANSAELDVLREQVAVEQQKCADALEQITRMQDMSSLVWCA